MSKVKIIFSLSVWVAILPYLGFPMSLKYKLFSLTGLVLIYLSYMVFRDLKAGDTKSKTFENFSENSNFDEQNKKEENS